MDDLIGKVFGPCVLVERIGSGGMAVVYKAYQESLDRHVAVKVLKAQLANDPDFITRFRREALAVARLNHPNILHVHDAGIAHGAYYIIMDYAEGGSLSEALAGRPLSTDRAISAGIQLAEALDHAHQQGLVHRDVKPSNVLLDRSGRLLLTDFGIAKALHGATSLTRTGESIGTPEYMAPEQVTGGTIDAGTDVYALGIVLYQMLAGTVPFSTPTPMATLYKQVHEPPPALRSRNPSVPAWLEAVVHRALAKNPSERFGRAGEIATALRAQSIPPQAAPALAAARSPQAAGQPPVGLPPPARPQSAPSGSGKVVPILLGSIAILVVAIVAFTAVFVLAGRDEVGVTPSLPVGDTMATATLSGGEQLATAIVVVITPISTSTPPPTLTLLPTPEPDVSTPVVALPADTAIPTATTTEPPPETAVHTPPPSLTPVPPTPSQTPKPKPTRTPPGPTREPGVITGFETFGTWKRGDEANGTFSQSDAQVYAGRYSGRLDYDFRTSANDYVVFRQALSIPGAPARITARVHGDGSAHFLNAWIQEKSGQVWQVPLGRVTHTGWAEMVGLLLVNQEWPWTHISGPDNGSLDFPVSFIAIVLDDAPDPFTGAGTIYIDDLRYE